MKSHLKTYGYYVLHNLHWNSFVLRKQSYESLFVGTYCLDIQHFILRQKQKHRIKLKETITPNPLTFIFADISNRAVDLNCGM